MCKHFFLHMNEPLIYLILTNFRAYLISRIFGSRVSRVLIFAIANKIREKAYYISCHCFYFRKSWAEGTCHKSIKLYISNKSKQDNYYCKLTTALHITLWTRQIITVCCACCRCNVRFSALRCSVSVGCKKKHPYSEHFKNYCFVFENGIKFREFFKISKLVRIMYVISGERSRAKKSRKKSG